MSREQMRLLGFSDSLIALIEASNKYKVYEESIPVVPNAPLTEDCSGMVVKGSAPSSNNITVFGRLQE